MTIQTLTFPFLLGLQQSVEDRLLDPGRPRAIENLSITKRGRLRMRSDYDSLAMTLQISGTLNLYDLVSWNGRLLGLGEGTATGFDTQSPVDVIEYVNQPLFAWRRATTSVTSHRTDRLPLATYPRNVGRVQDRAISVTKLDIAAGGGRVCAVWEEAYATSEICIHVFDPKTDTTILFQRLSGFRFPRVVFCGSSFFVGCATDGLTVPKLFRYTPASDTVFTALSDPAGAGAVITALDMSLSHEGTTFWMAYGRTGPTTRVHGFDTSGTETHDFAGPNTLCDAITVFTEAVSAGVVRIHLACTENTTTDVDLSTYLGATSALQTNTPAFTTSALSQVGLCCNRSTGNILLSVQKAAGVFVQQFSNSTHGTTAAETLFNATLSTKSLQSKTAAFFACRLTEATDGASTHMLVSPHQFQNLWFKPAAIEDRLIASAPAIMSLPNLAFDASTQRSYWVRLQKGATATSNGQPCVLEYFVARQARRQTAALGDVLYISGAITSVFDGRSITEAGFLDRPRVSLVSQQFSGTSFLTPLATYQFVAVFESFDANGNRIQSPPSDVLEVTLTGANNQISLSITGPHTMRTGSKISSPTNVSDTDDVSRVVLYRTLNAAAGNLTLYREKDAVTFTIMGQNTTLNSELSDANLEDEETLYTQGERESLSGPLPFLAPEGCGAMWPSADRILSGQLPDSELIQESRSLLPYEQANWSDSIGFFRATRGRILAVARLDERRIVWTEPEIFELDGEGVDDNGNGTIGAPRRLPSDCGLYAPPGAPETAWQSIVECQLGIFFRGTETLIYLLPRGGVTPVAIGIDMQDRLAAFPNVVAAVYVQADQTVRYVCNNSGNTDSVSLIYDLEQQTWITEGPYGAATTSACAYQGRMTTLRGNVVQQQRAGNTPAALIPNAWRGGLIHGGGLGAQIRVLNAQFFGEYRGDCALRCIFTFDDLSTETLTAEVNAQALTPFNNASGGASGGAIINTGNYAFTPALVAGSPYSFKFHPEQIKCESVKVDFEVDVPFPVPVNFIAQAASAATSININLANNRQIGDRLLVAFSFDNNNGGVNTPAGWSLLSISSAHSVFERVLDGTEVSPVNFSWITSGTAAVMQWCIRHTRGASPSELVVSTLAAPGTTATAPLVTPSWGTQNTLWFSILLLSDRPTMGNDQNIRAVPDKFRNGVSSGVTGANGCQVAGLYRSLRAASLTPSAWSWGEASPSRVVTLAMRPNDAIVSEGLAYHYWTMDVESAGKSALKSPLQMG